MSARYATHLRPAPTPKPVTVPLDVRLMHLTANVLYLGLVLAVLGGVVWQVLRLPMFSLTGITVLGEVQHNNAVTLRANVVGQLSGNFFTVDLARVRTVFEGVPWVRKASVEREFPNRLRVTLQEQHPVAFWGEDGDQRLLNSFGEVFDANLGDLEDEHLPRLAGPDSQSQQVLEMYRLLLPRFAQLRLALEGLTLTDRGSWRARLTKGAVVELGRGSVPEVMARLQKLDHTLVQVTQRLGRGLDAVQSVDLRHDNGYALRLRGVSTLEPPAKR